MNARPEPSPDQPPGHATESTLWHPVLTSDALPGDAPVAVRLLERDLVLWRDPSGAAQVLSDRCPHRGTRLSLGRIVDGRVECPYHGWQFVPGGHCVYIPASPAFDPPVSHAACAHEACEASGLVWVRLAAGDSALPAFEADADPRLRRLVCGPYELAASAPRIVENFLDLAHFGFVHEAWLGDRAHTALADYTLTPTRRGFVAEGCRAWQPRSNRLSDEGSWVDYRYELTGPYSATLTKLPEAQAGYRDVIGLFICPVDPGRSRVWFRLAVTDLASTDAELRAFQHTIFMQDQPILESQTPTLLPLSGGEVHGAADRASAAYRRLLREQGIRFGTC
jgi:phenylpropionate dioxygenase-like ring-hydroxylating dioxygenase large terminal subunit